MAYKSTAELDRRIDRLSTPSGSSNWGAILGDALKSYKANKLGKEREAIQEQNDLNQQRELAMILRGQQTGRVGDSYASRRADQFTPSDPALRELTAKMLMERSGGYTLSPGAQRYQGNELVAEAPMREIEGGIVPSNVREWEYFSKLPQAQQEQYLTMRRGSTPINLGDQFVIPSAVNPAAPPRAAFDVGLRPGDEPAIRGAQTAAEEGARIAAIPQRAQAELEAERTAQRPQAEARAATAQRQAEMVNGYINGAKQLASNWSTGWGSKLSGLPGTDAKDLSALVDSIKANVGFQQLQEMRSQSPTGAALGAVQVQELVYLQSVLGNLDQSQSKEQFMQNLQNVQDAINAIVNGTQEQFEGTYGFARQPAGAAPAGARLRFNPATGEIE